MKCIIIIIIIIKIGNGILLEFVGCLISIRSWLFEAVTQSQTFFLVRPRLLYARRRSA